MPVNLFLNSQDWKRLGCTDQQVKFLQGLLDRSGGATGTASSGSSSSTEEDLITINEAIDALQLLLRDVDLDSVGSNMSNEYRFKRLEKGQPEKPDINFLLSRLKKIEARINQLEDAQ